MVKDGEPLPPSAYTRSGRMGSVPLSDLADPQDADGTDGDSADGTDGDGTDGTDGDSGGSDADGTDGTDGDGVDQ